MNKTLQKIKKIISSFNGKELYIALILIAVLALVCMFGKKFTLFSSAQKQSSVQTASESEQDSYCDRIKEEITSAVKMICASDDCKVIINWNEDEQDIPSYVITEGKDGEKIKTPQIITVGGVTKTVSVGKTRPTALSCAVVCPKNTSTRKKLDIKYLINTLIGCELDDIVIYDC